MTKHKYAAMARVRGLKKGTPEYKRFRERMRKADYDKRRGKAIRKMREQNDPAYREKKRQWSVARYEREKQRRALDPEYNKLVLERDRLRKQKAREKNREEINAKQRDYYERNAERLRETIKAGKYRRDPSKGLITALHKFKRGEIGYRSFVERFKSALIQCDALTNRTDRASISEEREPGSDERKHSDNHNTFKRTSGDTEAET